MASASCSTDGSTKASGSEAEPAKDFVQIDPQNGTPATEPTEVRIVISKDAFYMGVTAFDSEPDKWLGYQRRRDEFLPPTIVSCGASIPSSMSVPVISSR
jgi:hypothetical protein